MAEVNRTHIGKGVGFKEDYEQYGTLKDINGKWATVEVYDSNEGTTYNKQVWLDSLWLDE